MALLLSMVMILTCALTVYAQEPDQPADRKVQSNSLSVMAVQSPLEKQVQTFSGRRSVPEGMIGTESFPFSIASEEALLDMQEKISDGDTYEVNGEEYKYNAAVYRLDASIALSAADRTSVTGTASGYVFDGQGYTISGLTGANSLFDIIAEGAVVRNLTLNGELTDVDYGAMLCCVNNGTIENCTVEGRVTGEYAAGIAGYLSDSTVSGCTNTGKIVGPACTGGIAGYSQYCSVIESANAGTVAGSTSAARSTGGIIGELYEGNVTKCCNTAQVSGAGTSPTGGIVGWVYGDTSGIVSENWNSGAVTGSNAGGIAGQLGYMSDKCQLENCYNLGAISGRAYAGGICGFISSGHGDIQDSYSTGIVKLNGTGSADVAGICGNGVNSALSGCYALNESVTNSSGSLVERVRRWDQKNLSGNYAWSQMLLNGQTVNCTDASDPDGADVTSEQLPAA